MSGSCLRIYTSISRSFISETSDQEIYDCLKNNTIGETPLVKKMMEIVEKNQYQPVSKILCCLVDEFEIYQQLNKLKHFSNNANKIELFIQLAEGMDKLGMSLDGLISYLDDLNKYDLEIDYSDKDVGENSVTIITIHRSKGLEYPIVYMPGLTSKFNSTNSTSFLIDDIYGPSLPIVGNTKKSSLFNHLIKAKESKESFEERLRLFYVAVTRARERLVLFYQEKEKGDSDIYYAPSMNNFRSFVHYLHLDTKYGITTSYGRQSLQNKSSSSDKTIDVREIAKKPVEIAKKKASKEKIDEVDRGLLEFGTEIHYLLEIADYETKDTAFITTPIMKKYVNNVLSAKVFENVKNNQVLHEYSFFDEKNSLSGVIDCLLVKQDEIDIIDFKLKNLDDDKYILQLHSYRDYIEQISDKPIRMFLISAITGEVKEIE